METQLSTIRKSDGLYTLAVREKSGFDFETGKPAELPMLTEQDCPCEVVRRALTPQSEPLTPAAKRLLMAWEALGRVDEPDTLVQDHLSVVLLQTVPECASDVTLGALLWEQTFQPIQAAATAAHPRAYKGTKYKPPKDKAPATVDLRPYLCDADGLARLSASLRAGVTPEITASGRGDVKRELMLPQPFRLFLWPSLGAEGEADRFLSLYWELSLDRQPQLLAAIALLVKRQPTANTHLWCRIIAQQPEEWRLTFASLLVASEAYRIEAAELPPSALPLFWDVENGPCPVYRLFWLFRALVNGLDCDYMVSGFLLADQVQPDYPFHRIEQSGYFPAQAVAELTAHLKTGGCYYARLSMRIWNHCGELAGLGRVLESIPWARYAPDVAYPYLCLFMNCAYEDLMPDRLAAKWDWVRQQAERFDDLLRSIPSDYQAKCVSHLGDFLYSWDAPGTLTRIMPTAFTLLERLCRSPHKTTCDTADVTGDFLGCLQGEMLDRFLQAPDASFQRLEEACRLKNNMHLIGRGTRSLTRHMPEFCVECFLNFPAKFFKAVKLLGGLPEAVREHVTRDLCLSPLMDSGLIERDLAEADAIIQAGRQEGVFNPVPRALQEHLAGRKVLSEQQLMMSRQRMDRQLSLTRLETLERATLAALQGAFSADPAEKIVSHALTIYHSADENRRALQKFLKAYWNGRHDYISRHPLNQDWLARHPEIKTSVWRDGVVTEGESMSHAKLRLAVEQDPLEALKLGTYVGSCLGVGGDFVFSAVAAVLDINKQVVYARGARGAVVARQLIALSEQNQLVCFEVYPISTPADIRQMFADYDQRFAEALNITMYSPQKDDEYTVETILAHRWWDDMAWNLESDVASDKDAAPRASGV